MAATPFKWANIREGPLSSLRPDNQLLFDSNIILPGFAVEFCLTCLAPYGKIQSHLDFGRDIQGFDHGSDEAIYPDVLPVQPHEPAPQLLLADANGISWNLHGNCRQNQRPMFVICMCICVNM